MPPRSPFCTLLLFLLSVLLLQTAAPACDLLGIAGQGGPRADIYRFMVDVYLEEAERENDNDGWGVLGWKSNGGRFEYRSLYDAYDDYRMESGPDGPEGGLDRDWPPDLDHDGFPDDPALMIIHARNASPGTARNIPDPHPFVYEFTGRTFGLAHNGSLGRDHYALMRWHIGEGWWGLPLMDRTWRGEQESDTRVDSELYAMLLAKHLVIAENYNLGDEWAIRQTLFLMTQPSEKGGLPDYSSLNALYVSDHYLYAWCKTSSMNAPDHKLWISNSPVAPGLGVVISYDETPPECMELLPWRELDNTGTLVRLHKNNASYWEEIEFAPPNTPRPSCYTLAGNVDEGAAAISLPAGHFITIWRRDGVLHGVQLNQMGLAVEEPFYLEDSLLMGSPLELCRLDQNSMAAAAFVERNPDQTTELVLAELIDDVGGWRFRSKRVVTELSGELHTVSLAGNDDGNVLIAWEERDAAMQTIRTRARSYSLVTEDSAGPVFDLGGGGEAWCAPRVAYGGEAHGGPVYLVTALADSSRRLVAVMLRPGQNTETLPLWNEPLTGENHHTIAMCRSDNEQRIAIAFFAVDEGMRKLHVLLLDPDRLLAGDMAGAVRDTLRVALPGFHDACSPSVSARPGGGFTLAFEGRRTVDGDKQIYQVEYDDRSFGAITRVSADGEQDAVQPGVCNVADYTGGDVHRRLLTWTTSSGELRARFSPSHFEHEDPPPPFVREPGSGGDPDDPGVRPPPGVPEVFALHPAYPNPFNNVAILRFDLPHDATVHLRVYDNLGREVAQLMEQAVDAGSHNIRFAAGDLPSGMYFLHMTAGGFTEIGRLVLVK